MTVEETKKKIPLYVLYASATGNAEVIAKRIHQEAIIRHYHSTLETLNDFKKTISKRDESTLEMTLVIVSSTTGNGDIPENGDMMLRFIKRKTTKSNLFEGVRYAVLGLGDTNYDKFNSAAKAIDSRLQELGGKSICQRGDADDAVGLEEVVEPWLSQLWHHLDQVYNPDAGLHAIEVEVEEEPVTDPYICGLPPRFLEINQAKDTDVSIELNPAKGSHKRTTIPPVTSENYEAAQFSRENPFISLLTAAKFLTTSTADRQVIHLELNISGSGIAFNPGDAIAVLPQNEEHRVLELMERLKLERNARVNISTPEEFKSCLPSHIPTGTVTVFDFLLNRVDLNAPVTPSLLRMLAEYCSEFNDKSDLLMLSSSVNQTVYRVQIQQQRANIIDVLKWYPSCQPNLGHLIQLLPAMAHRYFSISNSQLKNADEIHIAFTVVEYETPPPHRLHRMGTCTTWLKNLAAKFWREEDDPVYIPFFLKRTPEFALPTNLHAPMIMIGPGTGVAPFRGFLQHRECLMVNDEMKKQEKHTNWLFFGCRKRDRDFLYRQDLRNFETQSPVQLNLIVATSQESSESGLWYGGSYVQDHLKEYGSSILNIMNKKNGYLYVCGDANSMAKDVHRVLRGIITEEENCSREDAELLLEKWSHEGRYQKDVWT